MRSCQKRVARRAAIILALAALAASTRGRAAEETLEIGFAKVDITPAEKRQTIYHRRGQTPDGPTPVRDRLSARAVAFRGGGRTAVWVTADLLCIDSRLRDRVVRRLAAHGIDPEAVVLCATHTHTAPTIADFRGVERTPEEYLAQLESQLARVSLDAVRAAEPATIAFGTSAVDLNVNRRQIGRLAQINDLGAPAGLVDNELLVAAIRTKQSGAAGLLFSYAAHPLTMSQGNPQISADYPGRAAAFLEAPGRAGHAQFLQGCAGNLNIKIHGGEAEAELAGRRLAEAALAAARATRPSASQGVNTVAEKVCLPWTIPTLAEARAALDRERARPKPLLRNLEWAEDLCRALERGPAPGHAEVLVQATRVGDAVLLALPGEVFAEIGLAIKRRAGIEYLFIAAYANHGEVGYIPTAAAFAEGGYEVDSAPAYYGIFTLSPDCEKILVEAGLRGVRDAMSN